MKKLIPALLLFCSPAFAEEAPVYTAVPMREVIQVLERAELSAKGHGLLFGFNSIESCVFSAEGLLVLKHYCHPKRPYPARGVSLWSKQFGIVDLYEEDLGRGIIKKDIRISEFPESIVHTFSMDFRSIELDVINAVMEKLYFRWNPACWSTNYDQNLEAPVANCLNTNISFYGDWANETQAIVGNTAEWEKLWQLVNRKLAQ
jgi:hypothetical protein